jgi:aminomethyltransferase
MEIHPAMPSRTPLYEQHLAAGGRMVDFAGWEMPQQYSTVKAEHRAVRTHVGLFDVSHMGRFQIDGDGAGDFLQGVVTNDLSRLEPGRAQYNLMCLEDGGVVDDLVAYRRDGGWSLVVNAANRKKDLEWLRAHAPAGVEVADRSEETCLLALQGPGAEALLPAEGVDLQAIPYFGTASGRIAGADVWISRTGYTGEDGFEIFMSTRCASEVWDALVALGATPCGLACRDVCRLEAGLRLYGNDMDEQTNPYEAGLGWTVKLDKGDFSGRGALAMVRQDGPRRILVGLQCAGRTIPRHLASVFVNGRPVGAVTSGTYSFWLEKGIGFALIDAGSPATKPGTEVTIEVKGGEGSAQIVALPFYRGSAGRAKKSR